MNYKLIVIVNFRKPMKLSSIVSQKCRYALRAIFELSLRNTTEPVRIHDIASAQAIPQRFLEIILSELKHAGFLESRRGNEGGYILARAANRLTIGEVISFLEGDPNKEKQTRKDKSYNIGDYVFQKMWDDVSSSVSNVYNSITFADLVEQEMKNRKNYVPNYAI